MATDIDTKLGLHCAPTGEMAFHGTRLPKDAPARRAPATGSRSACGSLNNTRLGCAAGALGVAGAALDASVSYANERTQFGKPIFAITQMVQAQIAEVALEHEAARMLVYRAAWLKDNGRPNQYETSLAKLQASEAAVARGQRVHEDLRVVRVLDGVSGGAALPRDAKSLQVVEGTSERAEAHHLGHRLRPRAEPGERDRAVKPYFETMDGFGKPLKPGPGEAVPAASAEGVARGGSGDRRGGPGGRERPGSRPGRSTSGAG